MICLAIKTAKYIVANDYINEFMLAQVKKKQIRNQEAAMQAQMEQGGMAGMMPPDMAAMMGGQEMPADIPPELLAQLQGASSANAGINQKELAKLAKQ